MSGTGFTLLLCTSILCMGMVRARAADQPASRQQEKSFEKPITVIAKLNYLLYLPEKYAKGNTKWPLLVFLHGAGETGKDLHLVKIHGPPKILDKGKDLPFIVVSPQAPQRGWNVDTLNALIDDLLSTYRIDPDRVYLTGLSMGGYGTWALAAAHPEKFAAAVPICGGGDPGLAGSLKNIPLWVFHGAKDTVVRPGESERMVEAVKKAGGNVKLTIYPDKAHDSWTVTYDNPELYKWLLEQKRHK